ncbi:hypothetical protein DNTS_002292 [Danionella cerebrum]|nr:hypothetical protein DNTS_002292 [Danionella translucida]
MALKPFSPEEAKRIVQVLQKPAVFLNMTTDWQALHWTAEHLSACLTEKIQFRIGKRSEDMTPQFETECSYIEATIKEFLSWTACDGEVATGPFHDYHSREYWAYADYKYIAQLFQDKPAMFQDVVWSDFGFPGRDGHESTLWVGTQGANTPCHLDSYGCNLIFQVQGRKRWHLFPPDDTACLYPTRIPYEESSVFSHINVLRPDIDKFPAFVRARAHTVILQPGQVLFVPRHWWHYVESVDPVTVSVNSWIEMDLDDEARIGEALTRTIVCALKSSPSQDNTDHWLNPTEDGVSSHEENIQYLNLAVKAFTNKRQDNAEIQSSPSDRSRAEMGLQDCNGQLKTFPDPSCTVPFGANLIPVHRTQNLDNNCSFMFTNSSHCQSGCKYEPSGDEDLYQRSSQKPGSLDTSVDSVGMQISTNDLLDFLVHPDVIALVSKLIVERQRELSS